jgi:hypothetical protein
VTDTRSIRNTGRQGVTVDLQRRRQVHLVRQRSRGDERHRDRDRRHEQQHRVQVGDDHAPALARGLAGEVQDAERERGGDRDAQRDDDQDVEGIQASTSSNVSPRGSSTAGRLPARATWPANSGQAARQRRNSEPLDEQLDRARVRVDAAELHPVAVPPGASGAHWRPNTSLSTMRSRGRLEQHEHAHRLVQLDHLAGEADAQVALRCP